MRLFLSVLGVSAVAFVAAPAVQDKDYDLAVQGGFDKEGVRVQGLGVCEITPSTVSCWGMDGALDSSLTRDVTEYVTSNNRYFSFAYGKKNRCLIVRRDGNRGVSLSGNRSTSVSNDGTLSRGDGSNVEILRISVDKQQTEGQIIATMYQLPGPDPVDIPFESGAKAEYAGIKLGFGSWRAVSQGKDNPFVGGNDPRSRGLKWEVILSTEAGPNSPPASGLTFTLLDKEGRAIRYVNDKGEPVSDVQVLAERTPGAGQPYDPSFSKYPQALFFSSGPLLPGAMAMATNVKPDKIGKIRVSSWRSLRVLIGGFPMDPK